MKKILVGIGVLAVVVGGVAIFFLSSLDSIVKTAVERIGSDLAQTKVSLNEVEISPTSGKGVLRGFSVTNPNGFSTDDAFRFDEVSVTIDVSTISSDPVVIEEIVVQGPTIVYELAAQGDNLNTLRRNVERKSGASGTDAGAAGGGMSEGGGTQGPRIVIENLYLRDGTVAVSAPRFLDRKLEVPLPTIHLTDIGKDGRGATPADIANQTVEAILASVNEAVARAKIDVDALTESADAAARQARQLLEGAGSQAGGVLEDAAEDAKGQLKGLLEGIGR